MTKLKISNHALKKYCIRTGRPLFKLLEAEASLHKALAGAQHFELKEAVTMGFTIQSRTKAVAYVWTDDVVGEEMCALVRDNTVVTVLMHQEAMVNNWKTEKIRINNKTGRRYYV